MRYFDASRRQSRGLTTTPTTCLRAKERQLVASFGRAMTRAKAYEDIGPKGRIEGGQDLQERIDTLLMGEDLGIFVGTRQLALVGNGNELPWRETAIKIVDVRGRRSARGDRCRASSRGYGRRIRLGRHDDWRHPAKAESPTVIWRRGGGSSLCRRGFSAAPGECQEDELACCGAQPHRRRPSRSMS
jgi:hypothetical protein